MFTVSSHDETQLAFLEAELPTFRGTAGTKVPSSHTPLSGNSLRTNMLMMYCLSLSGELLSTTAVLSWALVMPA
jgi:hypothetical protein